MKSKKHLCGRCYKTSYPTLTRAYSSILAKTGRHAPPLRVYACPFGRGYHLTKTVKRD